MLSEFLVENRDVIEKRTRETFLARSVPSPHESELARGIPIFMEQLVETLRQRSTDHADIARTAREYGQRLFRLGFTVSEVVYGYGSVCSVVTQLAGEQGVDIATKDFEVFNGTLDVAIAEAVAAHECERAATTARHESERIGVLAHELRNAHAAAVMSFAVLRQGTVGVTGATGDVLDRSLARMGSLIDRSLAAVRLQTEPKPVVERFRLADALDQVRATVRRDVERRNLELVMDVDRALEVETDEQFLMSIVSNLVQNAVKYSRTAGRIVLRGRQTGDVLVLEVEDECGGLPAGKVDELFRPFVRGGHDEPGVGLGLSIVVSAVKALDGEIRVRDVPSKGCVFVVELPARRAARSPAQA